MYELPVSAFDQQCRVHSHPKTMQNTEGRRQPTRSPAETIENIGQLCSYLGMSTKERCDLWNELQYIKVATGLQPLSAEDLRCIVTTREVNYAAMDALRSATSGGERTQTLLSGQNKQVEDMFDQIISETQ